MDAQKAQIDLSLKRINDHQRREKVQGWKNEQRAMKLLQVVAHTLHIEEPATHALFAEGLVEQYGSLFVAFEAASADPSKFQKEHGRGAWVTAVLKVARENLVPPHVAIRGILELSDASPAGVEKRPGRLSRRPKRSTHPLSSCATSVLRSTASKCPGPGTSKLRKCFEGNRIGTDPHQEHPAGRARFVRQ